ncbi:MAG: polysulfide reductase NrfD [Desulfobacteraceae bacterium]|nr:polysulfide reductase NrfD [Desulfobacteraceae bacterium]
MEPPGRSWMVSMLMILGALSMGMFAWAVQIEHGLEWSGINHPIAWGVYITNFVFWIGIGHAGTLISAVLYLVRAPFRNSIYRASEAMTVFAVMTAGLFPLIHLGRAWYAYWLLPYPNQRELWINFKSPLLWDVFAISTYMSVSIAFFILGLIPDLATVRDESKGLKRLFYSIPALCFRGTNHQWLHYMRGYLIFAAIATPLVFSVHSIVSWDFAMSSLPGWHSTIFAPYFVAGAIFSGCGMVLTIMIPLRVAFPGFKEIIKLKDLEGMAKLIIFTSLIVTYAYAVEFFIAYYSGAQFERALFWFRPFGEMQGFFWVMVTCNCIVPIFLFSKKVRTSIPALFVISLLVNVGMWLERFVIVGTSLAHEFVPFAWGTYQFEWVEIWITIGSFGFFFMWFFIFVKIMPSIAIAEMKETLTPPFRRKNDE